MTPLVLRQSIEGLVESLCAVAGALSAHELATADAKVAIRRLPKRDIRRLLSVARTLGAHAGVSSFSAAKLEGALPTNPRFADQVRWRDSSLHFPTAICFSEDLAFWLMQEQGHERIECIFVSADDGRRLMLEFMRRFRFDVSNLGRIEMSTRLLRCIVPGCEFESVALSSLDEHHRLSHELAPDLGTRAWTSERPTQPGQPTQPGWYLFIDPAAGVQAGQVQVEAVHVRPHSHLLVDGLWFGPLDIAVPTLEQLQATVAPVG